MFLLFWYIWWTRLLNIYCIFDACYVCEKSGQQTEKISTDICLLALHAVEDETQEDEGIVAVVDFHIFYHSLTKLPKVAGFWKFALVYEACPWANGQPALVNPFFGHTGWEAFGEPKPVKVRQRYKETHTPRPTETGCIGNTWAAPCKNLYMPLCICRKMDYLIY